MAKPRSAPSLSAVLRAKLPYAQHTWSGSVRRAIELDISACVDRAYFARSMCSRRSKRVPCRRTGCILSARAATACDHHGAVYGVHGHRSSPLAPPGVTFGMRLLCKTELIDILGLLDSLAVGHAAA